VEKVNSFMWLINFLLNIFLGIFRFVKKIILMVGNEMLKIITHTLAKVILAGVVLVFITLLFYYK